jgi:hypothetical protein
MDKTTKKGTKAHGVRIETVSPTGHEEHEARWAEEAAGDGAAAEPLQPKRKTQERKQQEPEQPLNPKRNSNSEKGS